MLMPVTRREWIVREYDPTRGARLRPCGVPEPLTPLLIHRGLESPDAVERFLDSRLSRISDPFLLPDMERGAQRIATAVTGGERICIHGDYDVDGVTATALLVSFLRMIGGEVFSHIPHRIEEGYGLSVEGIERVAKRGATLVVTVDCGITALEPALRARELGIDLIVTDHHLPADRLPEAVAVIDPALDSPFPTRNLAGVGVAFFLAVAVRSILRRKGYFHRTPEPDLRGLLDFVALGTIADLVPLTGDNRILVRNGLDLLSRSSRPGIVALKRVSRTRDPVSCTDVGFRMAPRLNAAGRLEHAAIGLELLLTDDPDRANAVATTLDEANRQRQALEEEILTDAIDQLSTNPLPAAARSIVLASAEWHPGVIGIVASRIAERYYRPTVLIALKDGVGKGSCRSIPPLHLYNALDACAEHLVAFGGHRQAAGISVEEETLRMFVHRFEEVVAGLLSEEDLVPILTLDMELSPELVSEETSDFLERMAPFGQGNPEPLFLVRGVKLVERRELSGGHLRFLFDWRGKRVEGVWFFPRDSEWKVGDMVDVAAHLHSNVWQGRRTLSLRITEMRRHDG